MTSKILIPVLVPAQHRNRKLPCDTTFKSTNPKSDGVSEIQEYIKEWYQSNLKVRRCESGGLDSICLE
jgi:hypothetical protein